MNLQNGRPHRIDLMPRLESSSSFSNLGGGEFHGQADAKRWKVFEFLAIVKKKMESVDICYGFRSDVALVPLRQEFNETWLETRPHPDGVSPRKKS